MPLVRIEIVRGRPAGERKRLLQAVHAALVEAFRIPDDDRTQLLIEHDPENVEIPPGRSERYTLVEITAFPGRSASAKRALYRAIVRNLEEAGVPAGDVSIVLHEPPPGELGHPGRAVRGRGRPRLSIGCLTRETQHGIGAVGIPVRTRAEKQRRPQGRRPPLGFAPSPAGVPRS